jgi:ribosomal protein S18 acetylase RimI-like enzyme
MELVERIERSTLAAVSPQQVQEISDWLLPMDPGTVGRAHSAVPTTHTPPDAAMLDAIAQRYVQSGWNPVLRLPDEPQWLAAQAHLLRQGWTRAKPTCVMTADVATLRERAAAVLPAGATLAMVAHASEQWTGLFLGEGFDPVDGASRSQSLARSTATRYLGVSMGQEMVACGAVCVSHGLVSIHGLRTRLSHRGQGLATAIFAAMATSAQQQGISEAYLQVEAHNPARALYARLGFTLAWQYEYWQRP